MTKVRVAILICIILAGKLVPSYAQQGANDTIRLGVVVENGLQYPMVFLPEYVKGTAVMTVEERKKRDKLRNDVYIVYPYAITAAAVFKDINTNLELAERRRDRKRYLKSIDKQLDHTFKTPLKNLSIDQGHVLIKLINRQTGQNCYSIIKELKGGFSAMLWQSVGIFFNNNLKRDYDPAGDDREIEKIVADLEASTNYRYQLYQQQALMKKIAKP